MAQAYEGIEHLAVAMRATGFDLDFYQLSGGCCRGDLLSVSLGSLQVLRIHLSQPILTVGAKNPQTCLFCISLTPIAAGEVGLQAHGVELGDESVYGLDPVRDVHLVTPASYALALLAVPLDTLLHLAARFGMPELQHVLRHHNALQLQMASLSCLRSRLDRLFALAISAGEVFATAECRQWWSELVMAELMAALVDSFSLRQGSVRPPARIDIVKQAERWAFDNPTQPINLDLLCRHVFASRRSLIQGFQEHLGMGPMAFLKLRRLHGVRASLLDADPACTSVADCAEAWGFRSAGHFARDYLQLFGESPRQSLRRCPVARCPSG